MKVMIVGGGVAGLASAIALEKTGHEITVLEQAHEIGEIGAGINLWPNAMKALNYLGASEHIRRTGVRGERVSHFYLIGGRELQTLPFGPSATFYGENLYNSHRADLLDALLGQVDPARVRLDSRVSDIAEKSDGVVVTLESGEQLEADLLVGADGLRSRVRSTLFGEQSPRYTGVLAWRAIGSSEPKAGRPGECALNGLRAPSRIFSSAPLCFQCVTTPFSSVFEMGPFGLTSEVNYTIFV